MRSSSADRSPTEQKSDGSRADLDRGCLAPVPGLESGDVAAYRDIVLPGPSEPNESEPSVSRLDEDVSALLREVAQALESPGEVEPHLAAYLIGRIDLVLRRSEGAAGDPD